MMDKEKKKFLRRRAGWILLRVFTIINGKFPLRWSYCLGRILGRAGYLIVRRYRKVALDSLSVAFPILSLKKRKKIANDFFVFMAQSSLELLYFLKNPQSLDDIRIQGREYLDRALKEGKGVIIVTAHLGNFPLMSLKLAKEGYPVNVVVRPMRDEKAGSYIHNLRTKAGVKTILSYPRRECVNGIIKALRENELVVIQMDQNFGTGGVWVKFFGKLAATPVGPIVFALRTKALLLPAYIVRELEGKYTIRFFPQEELILAEDKDKMVLLNTIKFTRIMEGWIKEYPRQWSWIHRRWKSQPSEKVKKLRFKIEE
jgi:KDO2-lipid IV(A) lauroyltransferase